VFDIEVFLGPPYHLAQRRRPKRVLSTALDMQAVKHCVSAMQFDVSQHIDPLVPVCQHHQNRIDAAEVELNHVPAHQGLPGGYRDITERP